MRTIVHRHLGRAGAGDTGPGAGAGAERSARQGTGAGRPGAPGVVERPSAEAAKGTGRDPLTDDELRRAEQLAPSRQPVLSRENADGGRGPRRLAVGLADPGPREAGAPDAPRRSGVPHDDHRDDPLVTRTVGLGTGTVVRTGARRRVLPLLSAAGKAEAAALLIADPPGAGLEADHRHDSHLPGPAPAPRCRPPGGARRPARAGAFRRPGCAPDGSGTARTEITKELAEDSRNHRWWRVVRAVGKNKDGHTRSYEIVPGSPPGTRCAAAPSTISTSRTAAGATCSPAPGANTGFHRPESARSGRVRVAEHALATPPLRPMLPIGLHRRPLAEYPSLIVDKGSARGSGRRCAGGLGRAGAAPW
ncbi:hypothetical protein [Streptomyces sp. NPDC003877]